MVSTPIEQIVYIGYHDVTLCVPTRDGSRYTSNMEETQNQTHRDLIDEAIYLRGRIISSYAQVEFLLADFVAKLEDRFAYLIDSRIKGVKRIAEMPGYEIYKDELAKVCDELLIYDDLRHYMAHGFMRMDVDNTGGHRFEFLRYVREDQGKFQMMSAKTDICRLQQAVTDIGSYVRDVINLFERIYREKKLEPIANERG
jgi:hypothetical protein